MVHSLEPMLLFRSEVNWQLLTMADVRYNQTIPSGLSSTISINATAWSTVIEQVSGIVCLPSYSMEKARVSYDLTQSPPRVTVDGPLTRTNATLQIGSQLAIVDNGGRSIQSDHP